MDTIFYHGVVHTMAGRTVSAIAVQGSRIALAGSDEAALALRTPDGNYKITGRLKDMIIRGGENIYPKEIEEFIYTHEKVKDVQVIRRGKVRRAKLYYLRDRVGKAAKVKELI